MSLHKWGYSGSRGCGWWWVVWYRRKLLSRWQSVWSSPLVGGGVATLPTGKASHPGVVPSYGVLLDGSGRAFGIGVNWKSQGLSQCKLERMQVKISSEVLQLLSHCSRWVRACVWCWLIQGSVHYRRCHVVSLGCWQQGQLEVGHTPSYGPWQNGY